MARTRSVNITSISLEINYPSNFTGPYTVLVTTATPHNFTTGQSITVSFLFIYLFIYLVIYLFNYYTVLHLENKNISNTNAAVLDWTLDGTSMGGFSLSGAAMIQVRTLNWSNCSILSNLSSTFF
jgi:hypothetical protein